MAGKNHAKEKNVWLIIHHKNAGTPSVYYDEAVEEALCYGWIDSKANKRDDQSFYQFFARRNPKSNWSGLNKRRVEKLLESGLIAPAGMEMIELAKRNGTWTALDDVEKTVIPEDMQLAFNQNGAAFTHFTAFPASVKRGILEWIQSAKRAETRKQRIENTIQLAEKNIRANQYRKPQP